MTIKPTVEEHDFPHGPDFNVKVIHTEDKVKTVMYFMGIDRANAHIERYKLKAKDYIIRIREDEPKTILPPG
jgi:hypothetical protein